MEASNSFESANFDPIAYLNQRFPNQSSLAGLDEQIEALNGQLQQVSGQLIRQIHQHAMMNVHVSEEISKARELSKEVIREIGIIKQKATKSEEIVYEMCKDLKSLDIAKKNLTFSIDALKKFIMMVDALEKLRDSCEKRSYKEVANLISAFGELSNYFRKYEHIPQIQELYKQKQMIIVELNSQIIEDFESYEKGNSTLKPDDLLYACHVIEVLGEKYFRKFIETFCQMVLAPYQQMYSQQENATLENTERRYGWIKRKMDEFEGKFGQVFPEYWGINCFLLYEFCSVTRLHLTMILERGGGNSNVAILMKSLDLTLKFEQKCAADVKKKYEKSINEQQRIPAEKKPFAIPSLPKFKGSISLSFEPHLRPYIKSEQDGMYESLMKNLEEDSLTEIKVYNSSLFLFHSIKSVIKRATSFSRGRLMLDIINSIKKILRIYCDKCIEKIKKSNDFEAAVCWVINTGEHCKNIISGLEETVETNLDEAFREQVSFSDEEEAFSKYIWHYCSLISKAIDQFIVHMDQRFEILFTQISKVAWERMEQMIDSSSYIKEAKALLTAHFMKIKDEMNSSYLAFYMNKLVVLINAKFIANVYKCRKLPQVALQKLHLDTIELKEVLLTVVKTDTQTFGNQKNMESHRALVNKTFLKSQNIIKLLTLSLDDIAGKFEQFVEGGTLVDLDKILFVKGSKRSDVAALVKKLEQRDRN